MCIRYRIKNKDPLTNELLSVQLSINTISYLKIHNKNLIRFLMLIL